MPVIDALRLPEAKAKPGVNVNSSCVCPRNARNYFSDAQFLQFA